MYFLELDLREDALTVLCEPLAEHEAAQPMVVGQDHHALDELGNAPAVAVFATIALQQSL